MLLQYSKRNLGRDEKENEKPPQHSSSSYQQTKEQRETKTKEADVTENALNFIFLKFKTKSILRDVQIIEKGSQRHRVHDQTTKQNKTKSWKTSSANALKAWQMELKKARRNTKSWTTWWWWWWWYGKYLIGRKVEGMMMMNHGTRGHTGKGQRQGGTAGGTTSAAASARDAASIAQCRTTSNPAVDACPGLALGLGLRCRATVARSAGRPGPGVGKYFRPTFVRPSFSPSANIGCWLSYTRRLFSFVQE